VVKFPVHDWQFWVVTAAAVIALAVILRAVLPQRVNPFRRKRKGQSATLTVGGRPVAKR